MNIAAVSDLHGFLPDIPECDLCLIGGDIFPIRFDRDHERCREWADTTLKYWLGSIPAKRIVAIPGNHDFYIQSNIIHMRDYSFPWQLLLNDTVEVDGFKVHGYCFVPHLSGWAFHANQTLDMSMPLDIPDDVDILMTHSPAFGIGDLVGSRYGFREPYSVGSKGLEKRIPELKNLKLHVFGHIHECYGGSWADDYLSYNVAHCDDDYDPVNPVTIINLKR